MTHTHALIDDKTMSRCLPGAARFLAISAVYLAARPAPVRRTACTSQVTGARGPIAMAATASAGGRP